MLTLLGIILIFSPVFVLVSQRTKLNEKLWVKITNTILSVVFIIGMYQLGNWYDKYETLQQDYMQVEQSANVYWEGIDSVMQEFRAYANCVNLSSDEYIPMCSINHFKYVINVLNLYEKKIK